MSQNVNVDPIYRWKVGDEIFPMVSFLWGSSADKSTRATVIHASVCLFNAMVGSSLCHFLETQLLSFESRVPNRPHFLLEQFLCWYSLGAFNLMI